MLPIASHVDLTRRVLSVFPETASLETAGDMLRTAFGLTRAEAAVAARLPLFPNDRRLAASLGLARATVRRHLAAVRQKTRTDSSRETVAVVTAAIWRGAWSATEAEDTCASAE
jgi:FixJ family two-component response regulator